MNLPEFGKIVSVYTDHNLFTDQIEYTFVYDVGCRYAADASQIDQDESIADLLIDNAKETLRKAIRDNAAGECSDIGERGDFRCSECLVEWQDARNHDFRYCPSCGAKVVDE